MTRSVSPDVLDVARSVARLAEHGNGKLSQPVKVDGIAWTVEDLRRSVADILAPHLARAGVILSRVSRRDVYLILATSGADSTAADRHARAIAAMIRADQASSRMGAWI